MNTEDKKIEELCQICNKEPKYDDGACEKCYETIIESESEDEEEEESDDEEDEDSDWDGDLDFTPNCHQCGENCGRSIIPHWKYRKTYFCNEQCLREYDGDDE